ncbi:hypothetical protein BGZ94_003186 [Podila epigama]|nr:hypothetical protein BGZ94_003186 [Podila epigama]
MSLSTIAILMHTSTSVASNAWSLQWRRSDHLSGPVVVKVASALNCERNQAVGTVSTFTTVFESKMLFVVRVRATAIGRCNCGWGLSLFKANGVVADLDSSLMALDLTINLSEQVFVLCLKALEHGLSLEWILYLMVDFDLVRGNSADEDNSQSDECLLSAKCTSRTPFP